MAISAPTFIQPLANDRTGAGKVVVVDITLDASYAIGGEALNISQLGLTDIWFASIVQSVPINTTSYVFGWDKTNKKIVAYWVDTTTDGAALAEVTAETDLSAVTVRCFFYGQGA